MSITIPSDENEFFPAEGRPFLIRLSVFDFPSEIEPRYHEAEKRLEIKLTYPDEVVCGSPRVVTISEVVQLEVDSKSHNVVKITFSNCEARDFFGEELMLSPTAASSIRSDGLKNLKQVDIVIKFLRAEVMERGREIRDVLTYV